jgi:probable rRNA maturation factor
MIKFINHDRKLTIAGKTILKSSLVKLFRREKQQPGEIQYVFCSDEYLLEINKQFLQHNYFTDIITFDLSSSDSIDAEIYISIDRVKENAKSFGVSYKQEVKRVIIHGALHLCGYRDKTKGEITLMREKESEYLRIFEKANPRK